MNLIVFSSIVDCIISREIEKNDAKMNNKFSPFFWSLDYNGKTFSFVKNWLMPKYYYKDYKGYDPLISTGKQEVIFKEQLKKTRLFLVKIIMLHQSWKLNTLKRLNIFVNKTLKF